MGTPTADKLRWFYPSKYLASDGGTITQQTVDSGTVNTIVDAALTESDDYWRGAIGWFDGDTTTVALRGQRFYVKTFTASTDTILLSQNLPATPVAGDTYRLVIGGNYRGDIELFGLSLNGSLPELISTTGANITGLTITKASPNLDIGTMTVLYDSTAEVLSIKIDAGDYGEGLDVSGDVTDGIILDSDVEGWIQVDVVSASLPVSNQTDAFIVAKPERTLTPDLWGYEANSTRYRLVVVKNTDAADSMVGLEAYTEKPAGTATTISSGGLTTAEGSFVSTDASDWVSRGFWVKNTTVNGGGGDCRYIKYRSGNSFYSQAVDWATLSFDAGDTEIVKGATIEDETSGATAIVDQIVLTSGAWDGSAAGDMILKSVVGTFGDDNNIQVSAVTFAVADGDSVLGMRGYTAVTWSPADVIETMTDIDIGSDAPATNQFENPSTINTAPDGVAFSDYGVGNDSLLLAELAVDSNYGVWLRELVVSSARGRSNIDASITCAWDK